MIQKFPSVSEHESWRMEPQDAPHPNQATSDQAPEPWHALYAAGATCRWPPGVHAVPQGGGRGAGVAGGRETGGYLGGDEGRRVWWRGIQP